MHTRVLGGAVAWIVGAGMASALSMFAVSALGRGLSADPVHTLTGDEVARALSAAPVPTIGSATSSPGPRVTPQQPAGPSGPVPTASPTPQATAARSSALGSDGGTVRAVCNTSGAYLMSWSPAQGYRVKEVDRGPSRVASVIFAAEHTAVTLRVTCPSGVPSAQVSTARTEDHDEPEHYDR